ncbi:hypothetical protein CKO25_04890 [Thiocapsa imhoffii]|uniref:BON domain-containing protein n=1 Tax=Thiocapsa imhoffii TaxID=382777 RepID=A0A9X0WH14_9GAMM|nr:BON domain-containing protein [Thiocapsa imhoffii]MBK1644002.1 hypothetical protein [Thiocapsa imhoffii]
MRQNRIRDPLAGFTLLSLLWLAPVALADESVTLAGKVETIIALNPHLGAYELRVQSADEGLRLEGAVPSEVERALAEDLARLVGGGEVPIDNALTLGATFADAPGPLAAAVADLNTATKIRQRLGWQRSTSGLGIDFEIDQGIVRLQGRIGASGPHDVAGTLARTTEGVREVFNYINVDPNMLTEDRARQEVIAAEPRSDNWIANRVQAVLQYDTTVNARSIEVSASDGVVLLRGSVTSLAERQVAEALAADVLGVREVESLLVFERPM